NDLQEGIFMVKKVSDEKVGRLKLPSVSSAILLAAVIGLGNISAVLLLPILVYSFHLGIVGAAIATIASQ
ncbi:hypothetical protein BHE74_00056500, partial [Ensete ventricosum]